jgi:cell division septation protein DedD
VAVTPDLLAPSAGARPRASRRALPAAAILLGLTTWGTSAAAQLPAPEPATSAPYERARVLVESGRGAAGRALVDSLLAMAKAGSPEYAEALWWRAVLAPEGGAAERDLRTLVVVFHASPRAVDATLRLAQLDLARGRAADARERLERLRRERPEASTRARASYWLARAQLDGGDSRTACTTLNDAASAAVPGDAVARQVVAFRRRLPGCELTVAIGSGAGGDSAAGTPTRGMVAPGGAGLAGAPSAASATRAGGAPPGAVAGAPPRTTDTTAVAVVPDPRAAAPTNRTPPAASPTPRTPSPAPASPAPTSPAIASTPAAGAPAAGARGYTVQLAAYDTRSDAESMAARLTARGHEARVTGTAAPYRVRVGRWARRADAVAAQRDLAQKGFRGGWVADAEPAAAAP